MVAVINWEIACYTQFNGSSIFLAIDHLTSDFPTNGHLMTILQVSGYLTGNLWATNLHEPPSAKWLLTDNMEVLRI